MNRFDEVRGQDYISTYVRPPLELYADLAKDYQDRYRTGKAIPDQLDALSQSIKAAPIHYSLKDAYINDYKTQVNNLMDSAKPGDYAKPEFQEKANRIVREFKNDPRLNTIQGTKAWWDKEYQPYLNDEKTKRNLNLTNLMDKQGNYIQTDKGVYNNDFVQYKENSKDLKNIMDDVSIDGTPLSSISKWKRDGNYFIDQDGHKKEVTPQKIKDVALANSENYANTEGGGFRLATILNTVGLDPHMSYTDFKYNENIPLETKLAVQDELATDLENYGKKQIFKDTDIKYNLHDDKIAQFRAKKDIIDTPPSLGQVVAGNTTYNLVQDAPSEIKDILTFNKDGKAIIDWEGLHGRPKGGAYSQFSFPRYDKNKGLIDNSTQLYNYSKEAANAIGFKGEINSKTIPDILTEYNKASKALSYDYKLPSTEQAVIKDDMLKDRRNYKFMDEDGKIIDPVLLDEDFSPDTRVYDNGKSKIAFSYIDKSNKSEPVIKYGTAENLAIEDNKFHSTIGTLQKDQLDFYKNGTISNPTAQQMNREFGMDDKNYKGPKIISVTQSPTGNSIYVVLGDPNNRKDQTYEEIKIVNGQKVRFIKPNLPTLMKEVNKDWYNTPEGQAEANRIAPKKSAYEDLLNTGD